MNVCLAVISIIGVYCYSGAKPIGECDYQKKAVYCVVEPQELQLRASWYNPRLCAEGHSINCDDDPEHTADGTPVDDCFGVCIACPLGWYGEYIDLYWLGVWQCRDHGGDIKPTWGRTYTPSGFVTTWFLYVDFMTYEEPSWAYLLLDWIMLNKKNLAL